MAQRKTGKPKRKGRAPEAAEAAAPRDADRARVTSLERERDELRAELQAARERITRLEAQRRQAADRIDWVIDSLQHAIEAPSAQP